MQEVYNKVRSAFIAELNTKGDFWRLFRRNTFIDLIKFHFIKFQKEQKQEELIEIINLCLKLKVFSYGNEIKLLNNLDETLIQFNKEKSNLIQAYDYILQEISDGEERFQNKDLYDLNNEVIYLKIVSQLDNIDYSEEIVDNLIYSAINVLKTNYRQEET